MAAISNDRSHWITPEEQLLRLARPFAERQLLSVKEITEGMRDGMVDCAAQAVLKRSNVPGVPRLGALALNRIIDELQPLPPILTSWYIALKRLNVLPEKVPPLPDDILEILLGPCPAFDGEIKDTHILALVPEEIGDLNRFEEILRAYGQQRYPQNENPLQYRYFWPEACQEHGATPFRLTHWVLMTKDVLPDSRNKDWAMQLSLVNALSEKTGVPHEAPDLQQAVTAIMMHKVATGVSVYRIGSAQNNYLWTYTRVQETTNDSRLIVGCFAPSGLSVYDRFMADELIGAAALRKF